MENMEISMKKKRICAAIIVCIFLIWLDQAVKAAAINLFAGKQHVLIPGVLTLTYVENRGAAFGMLQGQMGFFFITTSCMIIFCVYCYIKLLSQPSYRLLRLLCITFMSGAIGNFIDRLFRGYVVDMIHFMPIDFPVFNIADCYITISAAILIIAVFSCYKDDDFSFLSPSNKNKNKQGKNK